MEKTMSKNTFISISGIASAAILAIGLIVLIPTGSVSADALERGGGPGGAGGRGGYGNSPAGVVPGVGQTAALTPLSNSEITALKQALDEEYGALNLYQSIIAQFGNVYPFNQIALAEQQHLNALTRQADKYGVSIPANPGTNTGLNFTSLDEAFAAAIAAEKADAALYDELKPNVTHLDILRVFDNLQSASVNNHLKSLEANQ